MQYYVLKPRRLRQLLDEIEAKGIIESIRTSKGRGKGVEKLYSLNASADGVMAAALGPLWNQMVSAKNDLAKLDLLEHAVNIGVYIPELKQFYLNWIYQKRKQLNAKTQWDQKPI
jgi:DNA-binding PadR family transcriptional regulator